MIASVDTVVKIAFSVVENNVDFCRKISENENKIF